MAFSKVRPLALRAFIRLFHRRMKGWVAHGYVEGIFGFDNASEDVLRLILSPKGDAQLVEFANLLCRFERTRIYIVRSEQLPSH